MRRLAPSLIQISIAVIATAASGMGLYRELHRDPGQFRPVAAETLAAIESLPADIEAHSLPPLDSYRSVLAKPLFSPTRQPPVIAEDSTEDDPGATATERPANRPAPKLRAALLGVIVAEDKRIAIIRPAGAQTAQHLALGEEINGWTLEEVGPDSARFDRDGDTVTLPLLYDR